MDASLVAANRHVDVASLLKIEMECASSVECAREQAKEAVKNLRAIPDCLAQSESPRIAAIFVNNIKPKLKKNSALLAIPTDDELNTAKAVNWLSGSVSLQTLDGRSVAGVVGSACDWWFEQLMMLYKADC
jgi:hypothetical protein